MIFDCGETHQTAKARLEDWHDHFALFPVTVGVQDGRYVCAWLQTVQRRGEYFADYTDDCWVWEYRLKEAI